MVRSGRVCRDGKDLIADVKARQPSKLSSPGVRDGRGKASVSTLGKLVVEIPDSALLQHAVGEVAVDSEEPAVFV